MKWGAKSISDARYGYKPVIRVYSGSKLVWELNKDLSGEWNGYMWVDLGLPSGTLWATCNVGANSPEEYGDYFAWGVTEKKQKYTKFPRLHNGKNDGMIRKIAKEDFAIIYVTEVLAEQISEEIDKYKDERIPAIIAIPGKEGPSGSGMRNVSKAVERAVGADILFGGGK